jgi:hypothetical protein
MAERGIPIVRRGIHDSRYERPNQAWVCGHQTDGRPCRIGPTRAAGARPPRNVSPRAAATAGNADVRGRRRAVRGGPRPDGRCAHPIEALHARFARSRLGGRSSFDGRRSSPSACWLPARPSAAARRFSNPVSCPPFTRRFQRPRGACAACHGDARIGRSGGLAPIASAAGSGACLTCHAAAAGGRSRWDRTGCRPRR